MDIIHDDLQIGNGFRGCRPEEYDIYDPEWVKFKCQACDFPWDFPLWEFRDERPVECPVCNERWIYGAYIVHDMQKYELRRFHRLTERQLDISVPTGSDLEYGTRGEYKIDIHPLTDDEVLFTKYAYLNSPDDLELNEQFTNNMLKTVIEDHRAWKRAYMYIYRVIDTIQDI